MKEDYLKFFLKEDYLKNKKLMAVIFVGAIILLGLVLTYWRQEEIKAEHRVFNAAFTGSVVHIEYDVKQFPTVVIGDSSYYIGNYTDYQIEVGDSIIKKRGSMIYTLIKHGSHKIIEFK